MKLCIRQMPKNGFLGGPKEKKILFSYNKNDYEITVEQLGERKITILAPEIRNSQNWNSEKVIL